MSYPYDRDHLNRTRDLLYALVPEYYKRRDRAAAQAMPPEPAELLAMIEALAAPLAATRQSVEELYADLFIESAGEEMLPALAASIGLDLVFRDAEANRRNLGAAMGWRRRKGTPLMLEEMARILSDRQVALAEGWKALILTQDLNLIRPERVMADLRPASTADRASGPLAGLMRLFDPRPIGPDSGHVHPRHLIHWAFPTQLHPLRHAACHELPPGADDRRFAFDADNAWRALRVRAAGLEDRPGTDRLPDGLFAENPGAWFGAEGRFAVRLTGVPAAASRPATPVQRSASRAPADNALGRSPATLTLIETDTRRCSGPVEIGLIAAPLTGNLPDLALAEMRGQITIGPAGVIGTAPGAGDVAGDHVMLLRLRPQAPAASRMIGATVIEVAGSTAAAARAATPPDLARAGYLRGGLYLRIPEQRITEERLYWIGADGSLHEPLPLVAGALPARALASNPVGPVWPEAAGSAERAPFAPALAAPGAAPAVLHGGNVLRASGLLPATPATRCALVLALSFFAGQRHFAPMLRLDWTGPDPRSAEWSAIGADGAPLAAPALPARCGQLGAIMAAGPSDLALSLRFESSVNGAILTPAEVAFTGFNGSAVLIHLPELIASATAEVAPDGSAFWPRGPALARHSVAVQVGADGSTWLAGTTTPMRRGLGDAAPLPGPLTMRRREAGWRRLCAWQNESGPDVLEPTRPGRLDIDPRFGLFAMNTGDGMVPHPPSAGIAAPDPVTVDLQEGATMPLGALPVDHRRWLGLRPAPTRLVSAQGHLGGAASPALLDLPLHRSVAEALAAATAPEEVIEIVDSGFYPAEALVWPAAPTRLELRAAPFERPVIQIASSTPGAASYDALTLGGIALTCAGAAGTTLDLPPAQQILLGFVSVLRADITLHLHLFEAAGVERAAIRRCLLGPLEIDEPGEVELTDSIIAAAEDSQSALLAPLARLATERATLLGRVEIGQAELSDTIVAGLLLAQERFRGCLRYSLVGAGSQTPRRHRVLETDPATGQPIRPPFVSRERRDPAFLRLDAQGDGRVLTGASDGGEIGAFNAARLGELYAGLGRRLAEHTPAGLRTGIVARA